MIHRADISDLEKYANACERASQGKFDQVDRQNAANVKAIKFTPEQIAVDQLLGEQLLAAAQYLRAHAAYLKSQRERAA
jgi:hypothetical protein